MGKSLSIALNNLFFLFTPPAYLPQLTSLLPSSLLTFFCSLSSCLLCFWSFQLLIFLLLTPPPYLNLLTSLLFTSLLTFLQFTFLLLAVLLLIPPAHLSPSHSSSLYLNLFTILLLTSLLTFLLFTFLMIAVYSACSSFSCSHLPAYLPPIHLPAHFPPSCSPSPYSACSSFSCSYSCLFASTQTHQSTSHFLCSISFCLLSFSLSSPLVLPAHTPPVHLPRAHPPPAFHLLAPLAYLPQLTSLLLTSSAHFLLFDFHLLTFLLLTALLLIPPARHSTAGTPTPLTIDFPCSLSSCYLCYC